MRKNKNIYQIDQSGKVEQTHRPTVVAYSNGKRKAITLPSKEKKSLQNLYRDINKTRLFSIQVFSILVFLLIRDDIKNIGTLIVDREYPGHEPLIKRYLIRLILSEFKRQPSMQISFQTIGKSSSAHEVAHKAFKKKTKSKKIKLGEVLKFVVILTQK